MTSTQFQIQALRQKSLYQMMVSLVMFVAALFMTAILPSLLLRYVYAGQQLLAEPKALEMIPLISFAAAAVYFIYVIIACARREMEIARLMREVELVEADVIDLPDSEVKRLEEIVDSALKTKTAKPRKAATKRRATRRAKAKK